MARFQVFRNPRPSRTDIPFLLDVQSDLVDTNSRVVVPLIRKERYGKTYTRLNPEFTIQGQALIASTADLAALATRDLGGPVDDLSDRHADIMSALDFLLTGDR
ncbi:MAG: CcdB family protein [Gammaproteobacteria bacterium]|jgi:toxin CcdB|nr:CcdB family protein [Gammaproteobacteria bacterium]